MIPYAKHSISSDDINAVVNCLRSGYLTQGPLVPEFEAKLCKATGSDYSVVVNSATSALHLACLALGLMPNELVWVPAISFVATANAAVYCGASVDFVDVNPIDGNICADEL